MSYLTVTPLMIPGDTNLYVDARTLFNTYGMNGRFRDWVRRTLRVFLDNIGADLVRYHVDGDSAKKKNYFFDASLMTQVVDTCITPKLRDQAEDEQDDEAIVFAIIAVDEAEEVNTIMQESLRDKLEAFIGRANNADVHADVTEAASNTLQAALDGLNRLLEAYIPTPTVGTAVPAARAPEVLVDDQNVQSFIVRWHPYSTNLMYENRGGATRRTRGYNAWCHKIDTLIPAAPRWFNRNAPLSLNMKFGHVVGFDVDNFVKSAIDALARKWNFNDQIVESIQVSREIVPEHVGAGSGLQNGYIQYTVSQ